MENSDVHFSLDNLTTKQVGSEISRRRKVYMKLALWFVNSALVCIVIVALIASWILLVQIPPHILNFTMPPISMEETTIVPKIEKIYLNDLFDTYFENTDNTNPAQPALPVVPPKPTPTVLSTPPEERPTFLPPLNITLRGIVLSSQPDASTALIEDETSKEKRYGLGEMVKDGQLVKIAYDRIILLRPNGQQDTLLLRTSNNMLQQESETKWSDIVKKVDDNHYDIDLEMIRAEVPSIGQLLEIFAITTAFEDEKPIGLRVGDFNENNLANALGFEPDDIITEINNIPLGPINNRIDAFGILANIELNTIITVTLLRNGQTKTLHYACKILEKKPTKSLERANIFDTQKTSNSQRITQFQKERTDNFADAAREMRARLLENMRLGRPDARSRQ